MRDHNGRTEMLYRGAIGAVVLATILCAASSGAFAFDDAKYPDLKGQWIGVRMPSCRGQPSFDPTKCWGTTQDAPLTAEYDALFKENIADQHAGGQGTNATSTCLAPGMPMVMNAHSPMEIIVLPETTYILVDHIRETKRRIFTDGRGWSEYMEPSFDGYSIGNWIDTDGDGRYDVLEVETRAFKGPRSYDASGLPLHRDNQSIIKERIHLDKGNPNLLHDDITVIDNGLTRPWTVHKTYRRNPNSQLVWIDYICAEGNQLVRIAGQNYMVSGDGYLMPTRKGQARPDLKYFKTYQR
jgi:hypothetical protein